MKRCPKCREEKPLSGFYSQVPGSYCRPCHSAATVASQRRRRERDPKTFYEKRRANSSPPKIIATISCLECGANVNLNYPYHIGRKKFCGKVCSSAWCSRNNPIGVAAMRAARTPETETSRIAALKRGPDHPAWIDGRSAVQRPKAQSRAWREMVFKRDNFTCQICQQIGGRLQADHIQPYATHPDLRWELSNGRTLCVECHKTTPTYGGKLKALLRRDQSIMRL